MRPEIHFSDTLNAPALNGNWEALQENGSQKQTWDAGYNLRPPARLANPWNIKLRQKGRAASKKPVQDELVSPTANIETNYIKKLVD